MKVSIEVIRHEDGTVYLDFGSKGRYELIDPEGWTGPGHAIQLDSTTMQAHWSVPVLQ